MVANQPLYIYIGGQGRNNGEGGFNGGGRGSMWCSPYGMGCGYALSGGGATDIRSNVDDLSSRLVVAGGGGGLGGPSWIWSGGSGGGGDGTTGSGWAGSGTGATTTRPGIGNCWGICGGSGSFGIGGDGVTENGGSYTGGGGGGGYFGGGGGTNTNH